MVTKICTENGHWFLHPESNRTWTNYTRCNEHTNEGRMVGHLFFGCCIFLVVTTDLQLTVCTMIVHFQEQVDN